MSKEAVRVRLVIFDWAGTTVDFGSIAPAAAFINTFAAYGVTVAPAEARGPMGLPKREHLLAMLQLPTISERWQQARGRAWNEADVNQLYDHFMDEQLAVLDQHSQLIPEVRDCVDQLTRRGIRIGATTGYFREAALRVQRAGARQGFAPEISVCVDDVPRGRPAPWMVYRNMEKLGVYPPSAVVKVGDTIPDIEEGLNAGVWSIGVTRSGSEVGVGLSEWQQLPIDMQNQRLAEARQKLTGAGAHAVIQSLAELPDWIAELDERAAQNATDARAG